MTKADWLHSDVSCSQVEAKVLGQCFCSGGFASLHRDTYTYFNFWLFQSAVEMVLKGDSTVSSERSPNPAIRIPSHSQDLLRIGLDTITVVA